MCHSHFPPKQINISMFSLFAISIIFCFLILSPRVSHSVCADATVGSINGKSFKQGEIVKVSSREIVIKVSFENTATHYRICENATFTGVDWKSLPSERPTLEVKYTLSEGSGLKTVYFQAMRNGTEASVVKVQFELT